MWQSEEWAQNLTSFSRNHPDVVIVDNYENVHKLDDRREMLQVTDPKASLTTP